MGMETTFHGAKWNSNCTGGSCVEVAFQNGSIVVRDGKSGDESPVLVFSVDEWEGFLAGVREGVFTVASLSR
ncbi:DUF397 domain-containing protein [Planotetraspora mira]|uniref:DUF397 domain-containing protein n=1 Tax=Planotetraspora mira TaxID=58121 RepID=A0A8J3TRZ2_9ACTN|nr:DUF397 domain-containing protein [Planotetraspora mira]GII31051.1 hypothetical protein Pmi06nite_44930 [Planotetraspora mira]